MTQKVDNQEKYGIQQTIDVMRALRSLSVDIIDAFGDGFQLSDLSIIIDNFTPLKTAIEGITEVDDELADLSPIEIKQLMGEAFDFVYAVRLAIINKKRNNN